MGVLPGCSATSWFPFLSWNLAQAKVVAATLVVDLLILLVDLLIIFYQLSLPILSPPQLPPTQGVTTPTVINPTVPHYVNLWFSSQLSPTVWAMTVRVMKVVGVESGQLI